MQIFLLFRLLFIALQAEMCGSVIIGDKSPLFYCFASMLEKSHIVKLAEACIDDSSFIVDISVSKTNQIKVLVDSFNGITIDECVRISRYIEGRLDRETEDFALEVSSAGLQHPFKVDKQYRKNIGKKVEVLTHDGMKWIGNLKSFDGNKIVLESFKPEKKKKTKLDIIAKERTEKTIAVQDIKSTILIINF